MAKRPGSVNLKKRIPRLCHTTTRGLGWHVNFRDPETGVAKKHRFSVETETEAKVAYTQWLARHLAGEADEGASAKPRVVRASGGGPAIAPGSLVEVASGLIRLMEASVREDGAPRARGTVARPVFVDRQKHIKDFLAFINKRHGKGTAARMQVEDLAMTDVELFNRHLVDKGYSASQVGKRMQMVKRIIDRAGRPEHGQQRLAWNWDSRDIAHGKPSTRRALPTVKQLEKLLAATDDRGRAMIWLGIGLGFGAADLSVLRVGQIDAEAYDLRRGKTGIERFGTTPPLVWRTVSAYVADQCRKEGELVFITRDGMPLVHARSNAVTQWWSKLRIKIGEKPKTLSGFYVMRHLGATEFGSRRGTSIAEMKRWLGHSAASETADVYMRPLPPENKAVVEWVRKRLLDAG
ncbi:MAG: site-specific integrase [Phycisphaerales bacterium]|nr:site-specific integrase [Phycisphaerales bacterium]